MGSNARPHPPGGGQIVSEEFWFLELNDDVAGTLNQPRSDGAILDTSPQCLQVAPKLSRYTAVAIQAHDEVHSDYFNNVTASNFELERDLATQPGMGPGVK